MKTEVPYSEQLQIDASTPGFITYAEWEASILEYVARMGMAWPGKTKHPEMAYRARRELSRLYVEHHSQSNLLKAKRKMVQWLKQNRIEGAEWI